VAWAERHAAKGDAEEILKALDDFGWHQRWMMFVGDVKGEILDTAVRNLVVKEATQPLHLLELGAFIGYSAVRIARLLKDAPPGSTLTTVEACPCNATLTRRLLAHSGVSSLVTVIEGPSSDAVQGFVDAERRFDLVFLDHHKDLYLSDTQALLTGGCLVPGRSVLVADNVIFPGCPLYVEWVRTCGLFDTVFHSSQLEYSNTEPDGVEVSRYLGAHHNIISEPGRVAQSEHVVSEHVAMQDIGFKQTVSSFDVHVIALSLDPVHCEAAQRFSWKLVQHLVEQGQKFRGEFDTLSLNFDKRYLFQHGTPAGLKRRYPATSLDYVPPVSPFVLPMMEVCCQSTPNAVAHDASRIAEWLRAHAPTDAHDAVHVFMHPNTDRGDTVWAWHDHFAFFNKKVIIEGFALTKEARQDGVEVPPAANLPLVVDLWGKHLEPGILAELQRTCQPPAGLTHTHGAIRV